MRLKNSPVIKTLAIGAIIGLIVGVGVVVFSLLFSLFRQAVLQDLKTTDERLRLAQQEQQEAINACSSEGLDKELCDCIVTTLIYRYGEDRQRMEGILTYQRTHNKTAPEMDEIVIDCYTK